MSVLKNRKYTQWLYYIVFLMLITSGSTFYMLYGRFLIPLYIISSLVFYWKYHIKGISNNSFYFLLIIVGWMSVNYYLFNTNHTNDIQYYLYVLLAIFTYLNMATINFERFKKVYLDIVFILCVISIIIYFFAELGLIPLTSVVRGNRTYLLFLFHNLGWKSLFHRLAGIYWEPGAYQIILITALLFYIKEIANFNTLSKKAKFRVLVILVGILLTKSTAAYLNIAILLSLIFSFSPYLRKRKYLYALLIPLLVLSVYGIFTSRVVQDKLYYQQDKQGSSYEIRKADNLAMMQMIKEKPLVGYGVDSKDYARRSLFLDNLTSSNGLLAMAARFGLVYLFVFIFAVCVNVKKYYMKFALIVMPLILLINSTEAYFYFPLSYVFIFHFEESLKEESKEKGCFFIETFSK